MDGLRCALALGITLLLACAAWADALQPLGVREGRCECVLTTDHADEQYLLVLGSLAQHGGPFPVRIATEPTTAPAFLPLENPSVDPVWQARVKELGQRLEKARRRHVPEAAFAPLREPAKQRIFHLFVKDADFLNQASYVAVTGELHGVGKHCQVYVDRACHDSKSLQSTIDEAIHIFDNEVWPHALGTVLDVDRDGRFTLLFSGWLAKMQAGQVKLSGFVRGSDFYRDLAAPFGNRCDMMYLNTDLMAGPFLRSLLAHEYTHAVLCSQHVFGDYLPGLPRLDEESWLSEAIAHLVEDRQGASWANLDYRISAYLNAPSRYSLVVPDYYGSKVWRDPGTRGCTYLFLRWCVDQFGPGLLTRLVQSNLHGIENLEVATQTPVAELFRRWSTALALAGSGIEVAGVPPLAGINLRDKLATRLLCGPRFDEVPLNTGRHDVKLMPTSVTHVLLYSPVGSRSRVTVTSASDSALQVSLVRLPRALPRLELHCQTKADGDIVLSLTAHHAGVTLEEAAWERVVTREEASDDTSYRPDNPPGDGVRQWFGEPTLHAEETRTSASIRLPPGEIVVRVAARDAAGRRVSAWALLKSREQ